MERGECGGGGWVGLGGCTVLSTCLDHCINGLGWKSVLLGIITCLSRDSSRIYFVLYIWLQIIDASLIHGKPVQKDKVPSDESILRLILA